MISEAPKPARRGSGRWIGVVLVGTGALIATLAASYLIYAQFARERLDRLDARVPERVQGNWLRPPVPTSADPGSSPGAGPSGLESPSRPSSGPGQGNASAGNAAGNGAGPVESGSTGAVIPGTDGAGTGPGSIRAAGAFYRVESLYPASATNPKFWDAPLWAGSGPYGGPGLPDGFDFVSSYDTSRAVGKMEEPKRIKIPAIEVDSEVRELAILDLGDSRSYETPAFVVGHIPGTANPGENGNGWYFGHLESPFIGEGNIFYRLPQIAQLLKEDPVDIVVEGDSGAYLYRVIATKVVHERALSLYEAPVGTITLVACVPSRVYDHRLLVTAQLIAERS